MSNYFSFLFSEAEATPEKDPLAAQVAQPDQLPDSVNTWVESPIDVYALAHQDEDNGRYNSHTHTLIPPTHTHTDNCIAIF